MSIAIGLDIGAVSLKLAALGDEKDLPVLRRLRAAHPTFRLLPEGIPGTMGPLALSDYRRITGSPAQVAFGLLEELCRVIPETVIEGFRVTGSGGTAIADILGIRCESEFKAISRMMTAFHSDIRAVFEMGGRTFKYIPLERSAERLTSVPDYAGGDGCEADMGIFLEQQAGRMGLPIEAMGQAACAAKQAPRISSGCSVFIKSDMIHAQQKGYTQEEIIRALCEAVAAKFKNIVVKSQPVTPPVAFIGGLSQNAGVARALRENFQLKDGELIVPDLYAWCGAIGAAMIAAESGDKQKFPEIHQLLHTSELPPDDVPPLSMERVTLLGDGMTQYVAPPGDKPIPAYLGIDVGSVSTKLAVIDGAGTLIHDVYLPTAGRPVEVAGEGLKEINRFWGDRLDIRGVATTGSGRELVAEFVGADAVHDEITAHKTGALYISRVLGGEPVDTIFEIGGQDSKYVFLENGVVTDFAMNDACAAGTGSFLEEQAEMLGIRIKDEFARLALSAPAPARLGEVCTVGTGNDLIARMQKGEAIPNLLAGLACAVARNFVNLVVRRRAIGKVIYFQGGTASNPAVAAALAGILGRRITVPPHNRVIGAIGAALIAREWSWNTGARTRFRGYKLEELQFSARSFACPSCRNHCDVKEFTIVGNKSYWGSKCSDRYSRPAVSDREPVISDLISYREGLFDEISAGGIKDGKLRIGLPRALTNFDLYPFWHCYLTHLGMRVVLSPKTDPRIVEKGLETVGAPFCHPIKAAFGHVRALTETDVDYILLPGIDSVTTGGGQTCLWTQTMPFVLYAAEAMEAHTDKFLIPFVSFREGPAQVKHSLAAAMEKLGVSPHESNRAVEAAYSAQKAFQDKLLAAGRTALQLLADTGEPGLVLVGRSYNLYDRNTNCDVPKKLRVRYGANVIPFDFLATGPEVGGDSQARLPWEASRKILAAAKLASVNNLHLIYISNFLCGPDAATRRIARRMAGEPLLFLQFDGLGYDAGYMTRCEAFLDSKGVLRAYVSPTETKEGAATC